MHRKMWRVLFLTAWELENLASLTGNMSCGLLLFLLEKNVKFILKF